jgi:hypothetical protein
MKSTKKSRRNIIKSQRADSLRNQRPPPFTSTLSLTHKFRFLVSNDFPLAVPVTRANLLNLVVQATTASTSSRIFYAVRLRSIEAWSPPNTTITPGTFGTTELDIEWVGSFAPSTIKSGSSMGLENAHVNTGPPADSSAAWWSICGSNETEQLVLLTAQAGTIFDVVLECRLMENEVPVAGDVPAGATPGKVYYDYLDGLASGNFKPVGQLSILP